MLYTLGFSCDVTAFVLNNVMADQFDDVREFAHCQVKSDSRTPC